MSSPPVTLTVGGRAYQGWTSLTVTRRITAIAGDFELTVSAERWDGQQKPWPIAEEDACTVAIGDEVLITGSVDTRDHDFSDAGEALSVSGRDATGALVDCSAVLDRWEFTKLPVLELCQKVAAPFGITVALQDGLGDVAVGMRVGRGSGTPGSVGSAGTASSMKLSAPIAKFSINPGDSAFEVIDRACRQVGVLAVSDGKGGLILTRAGGSKATSALVQGENILAGRVRYDGAARYSRYIVRGQQPGSDTLFGSQAAAVSATATDAFVRRTERVLLIRPHGSVTREFARQVAAWEATVRAARAASVELVVQGWTQRDGAVWPLNGLVDVRVPRFGLDGPMLIAEVTYSLDPSSGSRTRLALVPPNAFVPEPVLPAETPSRASRLFEGS